MGNFKLPSLPSGWSYVNQNEPPPEPEPLTSDEADTQVGSVLRQIAGPRQPPPEAKSPLLQSAKDVAGMIIPHTPEQIGAALASAVLTGGAATAAPILGRVVGAGMVPLAESIGPSAVSRVLGMGAAGGAFSALSGGNPVSGALSWMTQQMGGEGFSKVSRWIGMNQQARDLAASDPKALGEIVAGIIPGVKGLKNGTDFHAAFNNGGAERVASQYYRQGMDEVKQMVGQQPIRSGLMAQMRGAGAQPIPGSMGMVGGIPGAPASMPGAIGKPAADYSFEDAVHTLKRLRKSGWNEDEIRAGLGAMDAREAANQLATEIKTQIPPEAADKFTQNDGQYARAQSLIDYISDPQLLKKNGELNIPRLQDKFKADGYSQKASLQMTADAMALKDAIFRGDPNMVTDVPGEPGKVFDHFRMHFGIVPTVYPRFPKVGTYAGQDPYGLSPMAGGRLSQLLKRGIDQASKPISLAADEE